MKKRRVFYIAAFFLAMLISPLSAVGDSGNAAMQERPFEGTLVLGRPTADSISASITAPVRTTVYLAYGMTKGSENRHSAEAAAESGLPALICMDDLKPDCTYYYYICFRPEGSQQYSRSAEYHFSTPKSAGIAFSFAVQSDSHLLNKADPELYRQNMKNIAALSPDFMFDLGDAFLIDNGGTDTAKLSQSKVDEIFRQQLPYFDIAARNAPLFLTIGNHESEYGVLLDGTPDNAAAMSTIARLKYYPNPEPNAFYSGNSESEPLFGRVQNYYAFTWGDALFVSIDPYRYSANGALGDNKGDGWGWTLGRTQYNWFRSTLETSRAKYKFVFAHHAIGNMRGGAEIAKLYEWGGQDQKGNYIFDQKRPGWGKPIQQIMKDTGVTVFFQGHDHLFARETVDGVVYQTIPKPAEKTADHQNNFGSFDGDVLLNSGFLNIHVGPDAVQIDYNRNYLVASGEQTTGIVYSYRVSPDHKVTIITSTKDDLSAYGKNDTAKTQGSGGDRKQKQTGTSDRKGKGAAGQGAAGPALAAFVGAGAKPAAAPAPIPAGGFAFAVEADPHFDDNTDSAVLSWTAGHIRDSNPAFIVDLGDASMIEKLAKTPAEAAARTETASRYFAGFAPIPVHEVTGNHDVELNTRKGNYYSFTQENALFIVLDPYAYSSESAGRGGVWAPTLGREQYEWLKKTLAESKAAFKFVFIHNIVCGLDKDCRGGAEAAAYGEWGGRGANGSDEFARMRPGWGMPIHDLLVKYGVNIVFHGHDHFYGEQKKDSIVYQLVPQPGSPGNSVNDAPDFGYKEGVFLPSAGFLRIIVGAGKITVEYQMTGSTGTMTIPNAYSIDL